MAGTVALKISKSKEHSSAYASRILTEEPWIQKLLITISIIFLFLFLILPLTVVFFEAFKQGLTGYFRAVFDADALSSIRLTFLVMLIVVPLNTLFGIAAAWVITKYDFYGKSFLLTLIDLPFAVSPVISGLIFIQLFGAHGWFGPLLQAWGLKIIFSTPGIILATTFVTFPFVARELIPLMMEQGTDEEEAAIVLGASAWQTFFKVTLPNIKWGLLYGMILLNARAIGEFGAVSVVSGHIRGLTNTMPLHIEILYNEYRYGEAFVISSLLALITILTIVGKSAIKQIFTKEIKAAQKE
jgi:sulfate transport system permease protein